MREETNYATPDIPRTVELKNPDGTRQVVRAWTTTEPRQPKVKWDPHEGWVKEDDTVWERNSSAETGWTLRSGGTFRTDHTLRIRVTELEGEIADLKDQLKNLAATVGKQGIAEESFNSRISRIEGFCKQFED